MRQFPNCVGGVNTTIQAGKISLRIKLFKIFTEKGIIINCYRKANSKNGAPVGKILKHFSILYWKIVNFEIKGKRDLNFRKV